MKNAAELAGVYAMFVVVRVKSNLSRHIQRSPLPSISSVEVILPGGDAEQILINLQAAHVEATSVIPHCVGLSARSRAAVEVG